LIAHLNANKNVDVALEAARILASDFDVKLTIVGDGPLRHSLRQLACSMSIGDRVNFVGELSRSQTVTEIASADAVLSSSDVETFGITIAEALAVGVPVVATDSGGPADIVRRGRDGFIVPRGDAASMALAVVRCMTDLQESSEERRRSAQARFGFEAISRANVSLYQRVLG
jgi:glycosyltransferase involved in cell wall biosynthesis